MKHARRHAGAALLALMAAVPAAAREVRQDDAVDVSGVWEISSETRRGRMTRNITLRQEGNSLTGSMETPRGAVPITKGSLEGDKISFTVVLRRGDRSMELAYEGTVDGDTAKGTMRTPRGTIDWTGKRVKE